MLIFSIHVFCLNAENDGNIAENITENIISKHFSAKTLGNTSTAESLDLLNLFVKYNSIYAKSKNIFKHVSKNLNPEEIMIKQKLDEFIDSHELPNNCLTSFARIINAMQKSEL